MDFDARRREEVIQYVYRRYGRRNATQVADVITYRPRNAIRDMAKALGYSRGTAGRLVEAGGEMGARGSPTTRRTPGEAGQRVDAIPGPVRDLAGRLLGTPRHLGIHSAGMVLTHDPVGLVCPIEPARMENRTVLQWDKEDCAWMGLVKFSTCWGSACSPPCSTPST